MDEFARVKAAVKTWERAFRKSHTRAPTKQDVNADPEIAEQYALYRRLCKAADAAKALQPQSQSESQSQSQSQSQSRPHTGPSQPSSSAKLNGHHLEPPSTPTRRRRDAPVARTPTSQVSAVAGSSSLRVKRTAEAADIAPSTPTTSAKRQRAGYTGPIADPLPNPFSVTPKKPGAASTNGKARATMTAVLDHGSPFIHASSPSKLKAVLAANSLRNSRARAAAAEEVTPRTRARKRLAGEIEDTPVKATRRRRGERMSSSAAGSRRASSESVPPPPPPEEALGAPGLQHDADADETDDELGETPVKPGASEFARLLGSRHKGHGTAPEVPQPSRPSRVDLFPIFKKARVDAKAGNVPMMAEPKAAPGNSAAAGPSALPAVQPWSSPPAVPLSSPIAGTARRTGSAAASARAGILGAQPENHDAPPPSSPSPPVAPLPPLPDAGGSALPTTFDRQRSRVVTITEDNFDGWDPEASPTHTAVVITSTRRTAVRVENMWIADDLPSGGSDAGGTDEGLWVAERGGTGPEEEDGDGDEDGNGGGGGGGDGDEDAVAAAAAAAAAASPVAPDTLLSVLSLRSPARRGDRRADLRVRALLDPSSAAAVMLRALERGQDVFGAGEGGGWEEDEDLLERLEAGAGGARWTSDGDDDWESDPEGWKETLTDEDW